MRMKMKWVVVFLAVIVPGMQFFNPPHTNPQFDERQTLEKTTGIPPDVAALLERSCYDCHSDNTDWRWYTYVAPVSWYTVGHVNEGRSKLNFSEWGTYPARKKDNRLKGICDQCERGEMPLSSYALIHPQVKLSEDDIKKLCDWVTSERTRLATRRE